MKPAKMSDKIIERKIIQVSRTLSEFTVKHFFWLPKVCTSKIKIKSLPEDGATLVFHLMSARTVSPLCSVKGRNKTNSIQDFPKLHTIKEKRSAVSQARSGPPAATAAAGRASHAIPGSTCVATLGTLVHQDPDSYQREMLLFPC